MARAAREWRPWTEAKLDALRHYLRGFAMATVKAKGTLYLDLFAGAAENRTTDGRTMRGSARLALDTQPPLGKVILCELDSAAATSLDTTLRADFPGRDLEVLPGDCNVTIPARLAELAQQRWNRAPTFAFLDQYAAEISWKTIEALARFRTGDRKVELWMYLGDSFIPRGAHADADDAAVFKYPGFAERVDRMFGTRMWRDFLRGRQDDLLTAQQLRAELVNLMCWRLEKVLKYSTTLPVQVKDESGRPLYTMIFATDDDAGRAIGKHVFAHLDQAMDEMRIAAADAKKQVTAIEGWNDIAPKAVSPTFASPREPWRYESD